MDLLKAGILLLGKQNHWEKQIVIFIKGRRVERQQGLNR